MTDANATGAAARLHSQTPTDERGNFHYDGDLYRPGEKLPDLAARIEAHLARHFPDAKFSLRTKKYSGGRNVTVELLDCPTDLTARDVRDEFIIAVNDQMSRFGFTRSNFYSDYHSCSFFGHVNIGRPYWSALAARRGTVNPVGSLVSLALFKKQLRPGDLFRRLDTATLQPVAGGDRTVKAVRSNELVFEGPIYLGLPRSAQFACDGKLVRIATGSEYDPHAHMLYQWIRREAD